MQSMTWTMSRLGSRFNLLFEPYKRRVMHSALGRMLDQPMDLKVGLVEPDGTERVLPFTTDGVVLSNCEQFERMNSITFRGYSEKYNLRFEFNVHSVFYPQDERLCIMPAFYLEMRVNPVHRIRWHPQQEPPARVKLFIRPSRPQTQVQAGPGTEPTNRCSIDLAYTGSLKPGNEEFHVPTDDDASQDRTVGVRERIVSINKGCSKTSCGRGLMLELPVTGVGSGIKWRLVWGAHVAEPVLKVLHKGEAPRRGLPLQPRLEQSRRSH